MSRSPGWVVVGPSPPPTHGVAVMTERLAAALADAGGLAGRFDTRDPRPIETIGAFDLTNVLLALRHIHALWACLRRRPGAGVHLPLSQGRWGLYRDACFLLVARAMGRRRVVQLHGGRLSEFLACADRPTRRLLRTAFAGVEQAWVLSDSLRDQLSGLVPAERVFVVENAVPEPAGSSRGAGGPVRLLYLSNLLPDKGAGVLLEALALLGEVERELDVRFVGEAPHPLPDEWRRSLDGARTRGWSVALDGPLLDERRDAALRWADILVFPPTQPEGQPLVLLEAMAAGLAIVSSDFPSIADVLGGGASGRLVTPGSPAALAAAVEELVSDRAARAALGRAAHEQWQARYNPARFSANVRTRLLGSGA